MQWWNDLTDWLFSPGAREILFTAGVLFVSIVVAGLVAAWISRGTVKRLIAQRDRELKASAIAALVDAATEASVWNSLTPQEQVLADRAVGQADILIRLLPIRGAGVAANWSAHQLHELKRASATFGYQLEPAVAEFRDRLVEWQQKPARMRRVFQADLQRWSSQATAPEQQLIADQDAWVAQQHHEKYAGITPSVDLESAETAVLPSSDTAPTVPTTSVIDQRR